MHRLHRSPPQTPHLPRLRHCRLPVAGVTSVVGGAVLVVLALVVIALVATPAGASATCTQDWQPAPSASYLEPDGSPSVPPRPLPPAPSAQHAPFHVFCDGRYVNSVWLAPRVTPFEEYRVAVELVARAQVPSVRPAVNPTRGLTGLTSWFWAEPDPALRMLPGNGPGLAFELRVRTVRWRFHDGTGGPPVAGLGAAFPTPSPVAHVFERTGTFTVEAQVMVAGRVWGTELIVDLPDGGHAVTLRHDVVQVRSLLHER